MSVFKNKIFKTATSVVLSLIVATLLIVIFFQKAPVNAAAESNAIEGKHQVEYPGSDEWQLDKKGYVGFKEHMDQVVEDNSYVENTFDVTVDLKSKCEVSYKSLSICLVLDLSYSMLSNKMGSITRLDAATTATKGLIEKYFDMSKNVPGDKARNLTVIGFNTHAWELVPTLDVRFPDDDERAAKIAEVEGQLDDMLDLNKPNSALYEYHHNNATGIEASDNYWSTTKFTNMEAGLNAAQYYGDLTRADVKNVLLLSDGLPTTYSKSHSAGAAKSNSGTGWNPFMAKSASGDKKISIVRNATYELPVAQGGQKGIPIGQDGKFCNQKQSGQPISEAGTNYSDKGCYYAQQRANEMRGAGYTIYSVGVDLDTQTYPDKQKTKSTVDCYADDYCGGRKYVVCNGEGEGHEGKQDFRDWLEGISPNGTAKEGIASGVKLGKDKKGNPKAYFDCGTDGQAVIKAFETILDQMVYQSVSWVAISEIGPQKPSFSAECAEFISFFQWENGKYVLSEDQNKIKGDCDEHKQHGINTAEFIQMSNAQNKGTVNWDLKGSSYNTIIEDDITWYTWQIKFRIKIDNQHGYTDKQFSPEGKGPIEHINLPIYLTYQLKNDKGEIQPDKYNFTQDENTVPSFFAFKGDASFYKTDFMTDKPMGGVNFKLYHNTDNSQTANYDYCENCQHNKTYSFELNEQASYTSAAKTGKLDITNVPSGHKYKLVEESQEGYYSKYDYLEVSVQWGQLTLVDKRKDGTRVPIPSESKIYNYPNEPSKIYTPDTDVQSEDTIVGPEHCTGLDHEIFYTIYWTNQKDGTNNVVVTDTLSEGLEYDGMQSASDPEPTTISSDKRTLTWKFASQPKGSSGTLKYKAKVTEDCYKHGQVINTAKQKIGNYEEEDIGTLVNPTPVYSLIPIKKTTKEQLSDTIPNKDYSWTFTISANEGTPPLPDKTTATITTRKTGEFKPTTDNFSSILFTEEGVYSYKITEAGKKGWNRDSSHPSGDQPKEMIVYVNVVKDSSGLHVEGLYKDSALKDKYTGEITFENIYEPTPIDTTFKGFKTYNDITYGNANPIKIIEGDFLICIRPDTIVDGGTTLSDEDYEVVKPLQTDGEGEWSLKNAGDKITFSKPGTYEYKINEVNYDKERTTYTNYDPSLYKLKYTVETDDNENLFIAKEEITKDSEPYQCGIEGYKFEFNNTYKEFKKFYNDESKIILQGDSVQPGDIIPYKIEAGNYSESDNGYVIFTDTATKGLDFINDSFKIKAGNLEQNITPTFTENSDGSHTMQFHTKDINETGDYKLKRSTEVTLYYKCEVTEEALDAHYVSNNANVEVNNHQDVEVGQLPNDVPEKNYAKYKDEQGQDQDARTMGQSLYVGDKIGYQLTTGNYTGEAVDYIRFFDELTTGLKFVQDTNNKFLLKIEQLNADGSVNKEIMAPKEVLPKISADEKSFELLTSDKTQVDSCPDLLNNYRLTLTYVCEVTPEALTSHNNNVVNKGSIKIGERNKIEIGKLHNDVPEKNYNDPGSRQKGQCLQVGDIIDYQIVTGNYTGKTVAYIGFKDTLSKGLKYYTDDDHHFKLYIVEVNDEGEELRTIMPEYIVDDAIEFDGNVFNLDTKDVAIIPELNHNYKLKLTYSAQVTSDALDTHKVINDAYIGIDHDPNFFVGKLPNVVPEKSYAAESNVKAGDIIFDGDEIIYDITAANYTEQNATIKFTDKLTPGLKLDPSSVTFDGVSIPEDKLNIQGDEALGTTLTYVTDELASDETLHHLKYKATVVAEHAKIEHYVDNTITIQVGNTPQTTLQPLTNNIIEKTYTDKNMKETTFVEVNDAIGYSLYWANPKDEVADITLYDTLSKGLEFKENSASVNPDSVEKQADGTTLITWKLPQQEAHAVGNIEYVATVNDEAIPLGQVNNFYDIQINEEPKQHIDDLNNPITHKKVVDISNTSVDGQEVKPGDVLTYTIEYANPLDENAILWFKDAAPENTTYVNGSAKMLTKDGNCEASTLGDTIIWKVTNVPNSKLVRVAFDVRINDNAYSSIIENTGDVFVGENPDVWHTTNKVVNQTSPAETTQSGDNLFVPFIALILVTLLVIKLAFRMHKRRRNRLI